MAATSPVYWLASVDVEAPEATGTIVAFGDSITDGRCSTRDAAGVDHPDLYLRWVDVLAQRVAALPRNQVKSVVDEGHRPATRRFRGGGSPAALELGSPATCSGARGSLACALSSEGTNDITGGALAAQVIADTKTIIDRVHAAGIPIFGVNDHGPRPSRAPDRMDRQHGVAAPSGKPLDAHAETRNFLTD